MHSGRSMVVTLSYPETLDQAVIGPWDKHAGLVELVMK
jgi:hypothetical protein